MKFKTGIALSGGGARGVAHLGILKALEENGITPSVISGTSAGAIAGAFYAGGYPVKEILEIFKKGHFFNFSRIAFRKQGLFNMKGFEEVFLAYFPGNSFDDLRIPLYVAATDLLKGEVVYFDSGDLAQSLMASSCIPLVFQPVSYRGGVFVDGGVLNNFPVEPLVSNCGVVIGNYVNSIRAEVTEIRLNDIIDRSYHLAMRTSILGKIDQCDLFIEPPGMSKFSMFDMGRLDEIYEYGYQYAMGMAGKIKELASKPPEDEAPRTNRPIESRGTSPAVEMP